MAKKVGIIHTSFVSVDYLKSLFAEILPEVELFNIVDDSMLAEVSKVGHITPAIIRRICKYALEAEALGADLILNQCSSVSESVDVAKQLIHIPYVKIDEAMAEEAVKIGGTISVVATVESTMGPSTRLIERAAERMGRKVTIKKCLVDGAMYVLIREGKEKHNQLVKSVVEKAAAESDVVVLAQGSMVVLLDDLKEIKTPVLSSPRLGVLRVKETLGL
ncbi:MAG: aspartate/glutamate racemase family protein [Clostridia bacterium]|nr:aspartate/glutamate racemase family protein [Clostridia bacterium]